MAFAMLFAGVACAVVSAVVAAFSSVGILGVVLAYVGGGMTGMLLSLLATMALGSRASAPVRPMAPAMAARR